MVSRARADSFVCDTRAVVGCLDALAVLPLALGAVTGHVIGAAPFGKQAFV